MTAKVSIVIPTYNHAHFLGKALKSVIEQNYADWEAIVVDNHSADETDKVISEFRDPRIRVLKIHNDGIIAASRNLGIRESRGEWVAFLDSDDSWYPRRLESVMRAASTGEFDVISNDEMMVDIRTGETKVLRYGPSDSNFYRTLLVEGNKLSPSATIIRRDFLLGNGLAFGEAPEYTTVEDYDLWLNLARSGARFKFIHEVHGEYVIHSTNSSGGVERHWSNREALLRDHVFRIQQIESSPEKLWSMVAAQLGMGRAKQLLGAGRPADALRLALTTAVRFPRDTVGYVLKKAGKSLSPVRS